MFYYILNNKSPGATDEFYVMLLMLCLACLQNYMFKKCS